MVSLEYVVDRQGNMTLDAKTAPCQVQPAEEGLQIETVIRIAAGYTI